MGAAKILEEVDRDYPDDIPAITYIPDADTLIFRVSRPQRSAAALGTASFYGNTRRIFYLKSHHSFLGSAVPTMTTHRSQPYGGYGKFPGAARKPSIDADASQFLQPQRPSIFQIIRCVSRTVIELPIKYVLRMLKRVNKSMAIHCVYPDRENKCLTAWF